MSTDRNMRSRVVALAATALAALTLLIAAAPSQAKAPRTFFGVVPQTALGSTDFDRMGQAKIGTLRILVSWSTINSSAGSFDWGGLDAVVGGAAENGVEVLPFLYGTPDWVATGLDGRSCSGDCSIFAPKSAAALDSWSTFVGAAVDRYGPNGQFWTENPTVPKVPITAWQIWNEPNLPGYFKTSNPPRKYAKLVKVSDKAVNGAAKHAKTVLAGLSGNPESKKAAPNRFLKKVLKVRKVKKHFNAAALHPYAPSIKKFKKLLRQVHKAMKKRGAGSKPLWITEMGWGSAPPEKKWPLLKGVQGQKKMLEKSFHLLIHHRKQWHLKRVYWFLWRDAAEDAPVNCSFCKSSGLFRHDFQPKPAWSAFLKIARR